MADDNADATGEPGSETTGRAGQVKNFATRRDVLAATATGVGGFIVGGLGSGEVFKKEGSGRAPITHVSGEPSKNSEYRQLLQDEQAPTVNVWADAWMQKASENERGNPHYAQDLTAEAFEYWAPPIFKDNSYYDEGKTTAFVQEDDRNMGAILSRLAAGLDVFNFTNTLNGWYDDWEQRPQSHSEIFLTNVQSNAGGIAVRYPGNDVWGPRSSASITFYARDLLDLPDQHPREFEERPVFKGGDFADNWVAGFRYGTNLMEWFHNAGMAHSEGLAWRTAWNEDGGFEEKSRQEHYKQLGFEETLSGLDGVDKVEEKIREEHGYDLEEHPVGVVRTTPEMSAYWWVQFHGGSNLCGAPLPEKRIVENDHGEDVPLDDWVETSYYNVDDIPQANLGGCSDVHLYGRKKEGENYGGTSLLSVLPEEEQPLADEWYDMQDGYVVAKSPTTEDIRQMVPEGVKTRV